MKIQKNRDSYRIMFPDGDTLNQSLAVYGTYVKGGKGHNVLFGSQSAAQDCIDGMTGRDALEDDEWEDT